MFQRPQDGSEDFYRNWTDFGTGFGNVNGEFWLGITKHDNFVLLINYTSMALNSVTFWQQFPQCILLRLDYHINLHQVMQAVRIRFNALYIDYVRITNCFHNHNYKNNL